MKNDSVALSDSLATGNAVMGDVRILLVDDNDVVRHGLRHMLESEEGMKVVGDFANAEEALAQAQTLSPDVILMDIKMPGVDGVEATRRMKERHPTGSLDSVYSGHLDVH